MANIELISHHAAAQATGHARNATGQVSAIGGDELSAPDATGEAGDTGEASPVQITLSEDAQEFLAVDGTEGGPGKSVQSTAHRARAELDLKEFATLLDQPFGRIVSTLARFGNLSSLLPPPEPASETGEPSETGETGEGDGTVAAAPELAPAPSDDPSGVTSDAPVAGPTAGDPIIADATLDDAALALQILQDTTDTLSQ